MDHARPGIERPQHAVLHRAPRQASSNPTASVPRSVLALQATAGNRAIADLLAVQRDGSGTAPTRQDARPAGPGPGVRAAGDVSVSAGGTMTVESVLREVYAKSARQISEAAREMVRAGTSPDEAARWANVARNELKTQIRRRGSGLVRGLAEARNVRKYGNKVGPTYEELIRQGKTPEDIIGKAGRASTKVNRIGAVMRIGGWFLIAVDVAIVTWEVYEAEEGQGLRTAVRGAGGIAGAAAGGWLGMKIGGGIGALFGGVGAPIGAVIGGVTGAIAGGIYGRRGAEAAYDAITEDDIVTTNVELQWLQIDMEENAYIRAQR